MTPIIIDHETGETTLDRPHRKVHLGEAVYYVTRLRAGDASVHVRWKGDSNGYGGRVVPFLMMDGTVDQVTGPWCSDSGGVRAELDAIQALAGGDGNPAIKLTVGRNLLSADHAEVIYAEDRFSCVPLLQRIKTEWAGMEIAIHMRWGTMFRKADEFLIESHDVRQDELEKR